ncbi:hypothetical protein DFJ74DRAFT_696524 [Hyaloraphidium curvatum]|nr:hypothetical protein DFJ74DRAFT_696524 [Hyaloraphidium curvatum]
MSAAPAAAAAADLEAGPVIIPQRAEPPAGLVPRGPFTSAKALFALIKYLSLFLGANWASATLYVLARFGSGGIAVVGKEGRRRPAKRLQLYEWAGCPFCRNVREAISALDLEVEVYPTPRLTIKQYGVVSSDSRYRPTVMELGGRAQFPFLVDPNTSTKLYESEDIIKYLYAHYGPAEPARPFALTLRNRFLAFGLPTLVRLLSFQGIETGILRCPSKEPARPLELWASTANPGSAMVREALCSLEMKHVWKPTPWGTEHAAPGGWGLYLRDPNTGFESGLWFRIVDYLYRTYATGTFPAETLADYSTKGALASHGTQEPLVTRLLAPVNRFFGRK